VNCFVIMPFAKEFDDVYAAIKTNVEAIVSSRGGRCFRLDESRPAGPITDRLLREIEAAAFCVADVTGNIPNVMWEVGYAMALGKPIILITQNIAGLPFDIKDLQGLEYNRSQISRTLGEPLRKMTLDTIQAFDTHKPLPDPLKGRDELVGTLLIEIKDLKNMLSSAVKSMGGSLDAARAPQPDVSALEGIWVNEKNGSHYYAKVINGELVVPYCFSGNDQLTAVYYNWRRAGDYWFAKFVWLDPEISGFAFLRQESLDVLTGAWWSDYDMNAIPDAPPPQAGVSFQWDRQKDMEVPNWALQFLADVQKMGLANRIAQQ
jgi:hypothetical protein